LWIADRGLAIRNPKSEIRNLLSPEPRIPNPRSAITLTEVLISIGILTIGLLGVAAIFPVGSYYLQKGEIADRGSAIAQAAFNDLESRGMLNPANWLMMQNGDAPYSSPLNGPSGMFSKRFADVLGQKVLAQANSGSPKLAQNQYLNAKFGYAYVIDPFGTNGSPKNPTVSTDLRQIQYVGQFPFRAIPSTYYSQAQWKPWTATPSSTFYDPHWPLVRITLPQASNATYPTPLSSTAADEFFRSRDDLALDIPNQSNKPSTQRWETADTDNDGKPDTALARQARGDYTWMATIVPGSSDARNALASDPTAFEYEVSVAVSYKRTIDNLSDFVQTGAPTPAERLVNAQVVSTGLNGGQLLLSQSDSDKDYTDTNPNTDPFGALKTGNWIVVCGPHPGSTDDVNRFVMRWYRVLSIEGKDVHLGTDGNPGTTDSVPRRLVSLRGPQWPWQPAANGLADQYDLSNYICVAIVPSVVAVHSKTIRLEGKSAWSIQ
jgi:hypothetical protein